MQQATHHLLEQGERPMKWMWSTAFVISVSAAASAQSGKPMKDSAMADKMATTYTGCVEVINHGGSYLLTHIAGQPMMPHDDMMKTPKKDDAGASSEMHGDHMMASAVALTGRSDLSKHVGQKVTVTGSVSHGMSETMPNDRDTLAVTSLKVVAKSCS